MPSSGLKFPDRPTRWAGRDTALPVASLGSRGHPGAHELATWSLLSARFAGFTAVLAKIGVAGVDANLATAVPTTVVLAFAWAVVPLTGSFGAAPELPKRTVLFLVLSGLATGLSWLCHFRALQLGDAARVAPIDKLGAIFVHVFAALFPGGTIAWKTAFGGTLVAAGAGVRPLK